MAKRFDFAFIPAGPVHEIAHLVATGEALGFDGVWIPDQGFHRDPFVILEAVSAATSRIDIGVGITSPFTRHPVQIARAAATLAESSKGRFRLGLGTANVANVVRPLGVPYERPAARIRDAIEIIRRLLAGERLTFSGIADDLTNVELEFEGGEFVPIYIGTRSPQLLTLSGELTEGVLAESLFTQSAWSYVEDRVGLGLERASRPRSSFDSVAWQLAFVTEDPKSKIDQYRPWIARSLQVGPPDAIARIGVDPETIARVADASAQYGADSAQATAAVSDDAVRCFLIAGPSRDVIDQIARIFSDGADTINVLDTGPLAAVHQNLSAFASHVLPAFK